MQRVGRMHNSENEVRRSDEGAVAMHHREITLADGRYMIFYTFGETDEASVEHDKKDKNV